MSEEQSRSRQEAQGREGVSLRVGDQQRDACLEVLARAYAEGRLDADEHAQRGEAAQRARTEADLRPLLADLVVASGSGPREVSPAEDLHRRAVQRWRRQRDEGLRSFLVVTVVCWAVWSATSFGGFPWPLFPMLGTSACFLGALLRREEIVAGHERELGRQDRLRIGRTGTAQAACP